MAPQHLTYPHNVGAFLIPSLGSVLESLVPLKRGALCCSPKTPVHRGLNTHYTLVFRRAWTSSQRWWGAGNWVPARSPQHLYILAGALETP